MSEEITQEEYEAFKALPPEPGSRMAVAQAECDALADENKRLRLLIGELLDATGLDDAERTEWLDRNRLSESAVYPDDDADDDEPLPASYYADARVQ